MKPFGSAIRYARRYRLDGNPLRRRTDRLETCAVMLAVLLVSVSVWPAILAGRLAYQDALADSRVGPGARQQVTATLMTEVPRARVTFGSEAAVQAPPVLARWTAPDGVVHTGYVPVSQPAAAGSTTRIWIDPSGMPTSPPTAASMVTVKGVGMGAFVVSMTMLLVFTMLRVFRWLVDRRRYRAWDRAWERADELWHRPRRS
ncbi:Rv1733c family protein [Nonomuraea sp. NPDC002799]